MDRKPPEQYSTKGNPVLKIAIGEIIQNKYTCTELGKTGYIHNNLLSFYQCSLKYSPGVKFDSAHGVKFSMGL